MPHPFTVITEQSLKSQLSEQERQALQSARTRFRIYSILGGLGGSALGFYLSRRNKSLAMRGLMIFFNGAFFSSITSGYSSITSLRELSDPTKYPHITAAMKDVRNEILRSRGVDPEHPELGRVGVVPHKPDFKHLPPSTVNDQEERAAGFGFGDSRNVAQNSQHHEFGNPGMHDFGISVDSVDNDRQLSTWDKIRREKGQPEDTWQKIRRQNPQQQNQQQPQENAARQLEDAWNQLNQNPRTGGVYGNNVFSSSDDASYAPGAPALNSEDFPRSREDFENQHGASGDRYGSGGAFPA
ncbi:hypothetical protein BX661DRAFT_175564 [Kickxella alabastrina]|uniref:uncharacterized protein n=1 Tax=Kickxella alabastrina TaxID=61397 RepID=UPI00221F024C|nr:uncharacterized protein BX661DRAFT_175564 [Kickxella alabastrina]KAI7834811.1 hypothetical protein BX661DRAFT_175564 [Kickxella alabastrina]KAJ1946402.1 hypothetical protein GGF37_001183 [Kickxella alabastrina]